MVFILTVGDRMRTRERGGGKKISQNFVNVIFRWSPRKDTATIDASAVPSPLNMRFFSYLGQARLRTEPGKSPPNPLEEGDSL